MLLGGYSVNETHSMIIINDTLVATSRHSNTCAETITLASVAY